MKTFNLALYKTITLVIIVHSNSVKCLSATTPTRVHVWECCCCTYR